MRKITNAFVNFMKNQKWEFILSCVKLGIMFFFFVSMMTPFYASFGLGIRIRTTIFSISAGWLILLVYLAGMVGFVYFTIFEKADWVKRVLVGILGFSGLMFLIMIIRFFSDVVSVPSYVDVYLSIGFFLYLLFGGLIAVSIFKLEWIELVVRKFIKPQAQPVQQEIHPES